MSSFFILGINLTLSKGIPFGDEVLTQQKSFNFEHDKAG